MKVKELIDKLKSLSPEADVWIDYGAVNCLEAINASESDDQSVVTIESY